MMKKKVLPALALAFLVLLGSEMTVFAAEEYCVVESCSCGRTKISRGAIVHGGDKIHVGGQGSLNIDGDLAPRNGEKVATVPGDFSKEYQYKYVSSELVYDQILNIYHFASDVVPVTPPVSGQEADPVSGQEADPVPVSAGNAVSHEHYYEWVEAYEPSVSGDGLMQHKCSCGSVDDQYTVPAAVAYLQTFCTDIQNAPENAVVEWKPEMFRCYTRRMMEELAKRPDVTLITTYTEVDGTTKSFTIPAGQALVDDDLFYGFTYLGNLYGWN